MSNDLNYLYVFKFYDHGNIINHGHHYVLATDINHAIKMVKNTFPNLSILSHTKISNDPIEKSEAIKLIDKHHKEFPVGRLRI